MFHVPRELQSIIHTRCGFGCRRKGYATKKSGNIEIPVIQSHVLRVSQTRGVPSTCVDLKEALCEKIPLHHDFIRNLRNNYGPLMISGITINDLYRGLRGVSTLVRETTEVDTKYGIKYRGLTIPEVLNLIPHHGTSPIPEGIFWLLLTGDVPTKEQTDWLVADWSSRREKCRHWWSGPNGGTVGSVLRALPKTLSPMMKLSIALTVIDTGKHERHALKMNALPHTHWEYAYEDSMELLASLPAIVGLLAKDRELKSVKEQGDWVSFQLECLQDVSEDLERMHSSAGDFLRLYIALNADDDGGVPGIHISQILGASPINQALAAGILAYSEEPKSGTLLQYMDFQEKLQNHLSRDTHEEAVVNFMGKLVEKYGAVGHKECNFPDSRYRALLYYAKQRLGNNPGTQISQGITRLVRSIVKRTTGTTVCPEQNCMAAPLFQFYGLKDMAFNQTLFCMSRTLGAVASIIWARAMDTSVERPRSRCSSTYMNVIREATKAPRSTIIKSMCKKQLKHNPAQKSLPTE